MALLTCEDCGGDVSDRAPACPNCGAPVAVTGEDISKPDKVSLGGDYFIATKTLLIAHTVKAIQALNYKVDSVDQASGLVAFTTGMTWGSWSGVSGSIFLENCGGNKFKASGNAKQNVRGGQIIALNLFGEADGKVSNVIEQMRRMAA